MAYVAMAYVVVAYVGMAYVVMAGIGMAVFVVRIRTMLAPTFLTCASCVQQCVCARMR